MRLRLSARWSKLAAKERVALSAPTSAGKSFVLQNYLVSAFSESRPLSIVYIVPTRALITQVALDLNEQSVLEKMLHVVVVVVPMAAIILYIAKKSHRLAEFLDAISDERQPPSYKLQAFLRIWKRKR